MANARFFDWWFMYTGGMVVGHVAFETIGGVVIASVLTGAFLLGVSAARARFRTQAAP